MTNSQKKNKGKFNKQTGASAPKEVRSMDKKSFWSRAKSWFKGSYKKVAGALRRTWGRVTAVMARAWTATRTAVVRNNVGRTFVNIVVPVGRRVLNRLGCIGLVAFYLAGLAVAPGAVIAGSVAAVAGLWFIGVTLGALEKSQSKVVHVFLQALDYALHAATLAFELLTAFVIGSLMFEMGAVVVTLFVLAIGVLGYQEVVQKLHTTEYPDAVDAATGIPMPDQGGQGPSPFHKGRKATGPVIDLTT